MRFLLNILGDFATYFSMILPFIFLKSFAISGRAYRLFTFYLILIGFIQFGQIFCTRVLKLESNIFLSHYYFIGQFILLSMFFGVLLKAKWVYGIMAMVLLALTFQYVLQPEIYFYYNGYGLFITHLILVFFAIIYLYRSLGERSEFLLITIGIILYFTTSSLIFYTGNLAFNTSIPKGTIKLISDLNSILYLVFQILILVEWWKNHSRLKQTL